MVERTEYYPYGRPRHEQHAGFDSAYTFTGKELDRSTGLMYFEARYYEPVTGRFVSVDPLALIPEALPRDRSHSLNLYAYAWNNRSHTGTLPALILKVTEGRNFKRRENCCQEVGRAPQRAGATHRRAQGGGRGEQVEQSQSRKSAWL